MARTSARNQLLDILLDPMAAAILASVGLHASIGASLPYWLQPLKTGVNNPGTDTVKVVELTPNELQRIPQVAPQPEPTPVATPTPQATTPATTAQPTVKPAPAKQPSPPKFGTAPLRIPFSPIPAVGGTVPAPATTPTAPVRNTPATGKPARPSRSTQAAPTIVDPYDFFPKTETPNQPAAPKGNKIRPTTRPSPAISTPPTQPKKSQPNRKTANTDRRDDRNANDNSEDNGTPKPQTTPTTAPSKQNPTGNGSPTGRPGAKPTAQSNPEAGTANGTNPGNDNDGNIPAEVQTMVEKQRKKYPGLKVDKSSVKRAYPPTAKGCLRGQPSLYVGVLYDKFRPIYDEDPNSQDPNIPKSSTTNPNDSILQSSKMAASPIMDALSPYTKGDPAIENNPDLKQQAVRTGLAAASEKNSQRPPADRNKQILYITRITFDSSTCK